MLGQTGWMSHPSPKYPPFTSTGTSLQVGERGGALSGPHLCYSTQSKAVAHSRSQHFHRGKWCVCVCVCVCLGRYR